MFDVVDLVEDVKNRIAGVEVEELNARQDAAHRLREGLPATAGDAAPAWRLEIVDEQKTAFREVGAQAGRLGVGDRPPADLDDVSDRMLEQLRIVERDGVDLV